MVAAGGLSVGTLNLQTHDQRDKVSELGEGGFSVYFGRPHLCL